MSGAFMETAWIEAKSVGLRCGRRSEFKSNSRFSWISNLILHFFPPKKTKNCSMFRMNKCLFSVRSSNASINYQIRGKIYFAQRQTKIYTHSPIKSNFFSFFMSKEVFIEAFIHSRAHQTFLTSVPPKPKMKKKKKQKTYNVIWNIWNHL